MLIALLAAAVAAAPMVITEPHWLEKPAVADITEVYPIQARRAQISGKVITECRVDEGGWLRECRVFAEAPLGQGFGAAVLKLTAKFRMAPPAHPSPGVAPTFFLPVILKMQGNPVPAQLVMEAPRWAAAPTFADVAHTYPASAKGAAGDVTLRCKVASGGVLGPCETRRERPSGEGFADAARALVGRFRADMDGYVLRPRDDLAADVNFHFVDPKGDAFANRRIAQPSWLTVPDPAQAAALFPTAASAKGVKTSSGVAAN